jgi:DNA-binding NtrC family response regulator
LEALSLGDQFLAEKSILLLEDEYLIAMDVEQLCRDHGAGRVAIARSLEEAERLRESGDHFDIAVIDVMLGNVPTLDFAARLEKLGIPFVFATGYIDIEEIGGHFPEVGMVKKPYRGEDLIDAMRTALAGRAVRASSIL